MLRRDGFNGNLLDLAFHHLAFGSRKFFLEFFHAACGVGEALLAGIERVAGGADLHLDHRLYGAGLESVAAGAGDRANIIFGMYVVFHSRFQYLCKCRTKVMPVPNQEPCSSSGQALYASDSLVKIYNKSLKLYHISGAPRLKKYAAL